MTEAACKDTRINTFLAVLLVTGKRWGKLSAHQEEWLNQPSLYILCHITARKRKLYHLEICYILFSKKSKI